MRGFVGALRRTAGLIVSLPIVAVTPGCQESGASSEAEVAEERQPLRVVVAERHDGGV